MEQKLKNNADKKQSLMSSMCLSPMFPYRSDEINKEMTFDDSLLN